MNIVGICIFPLFFWHTEPALTRWPVPLYLNWCLVAGSNDVLYSLPTASTPTQYAAQLRRLSDCVHTSSKRQQDRQRDIFDRRPRGEPYAIGDRVMLHKPEVPRGHSREFHRPWKSPYWIVRVLGPTVYRTEDCTHPKRKKVVHFNRLKLLSDLNVPSCPDPSEKPSTAVIPPTTSTLNLQDGYDDEEYEFDSDG